MHKTKIQIGIRSKQIKELVAIDRESYGSEPEESFLQFAQENKDAYLILTTGEKVQGYGLVIPVTCEGIEGIIHGKMDESEILKNTMHYKDAEGFYIASIATRQNLPGALASRLVGYTAGQIIRSEKPVIAVAVSHFGEGIAHEIGMQENRYTGPIRGVGNFNPKLFRKN